MDTAAHTAALGEGYGVWREGGDVPLTPSLVGPAMEQLASLVERETVLVRQDTAFSLPGT